MSWQDLSLILPAFIAGIIVVASHIPLGREVVKRGIIFIDLAIAQIAGVGVIAAGLFDIESAIGTQLFAGGAALAGALLLIITEKKLGRFQEPLIGVLFVLAASLGLLMLANDPHGGESLKEMLSGQVLWVTSQHILLSAAVLLPTTALWLLLKNKFGEAAFYPLFAIAITASVQLVGVYLVFATLVIPALAIIRAKRYPLLKGLTIGVLGYGIGLLVSLKWDLAASPIIVWCLASLSLLFALVFSKAKQLNLQ